jgi:hypothetical protein
MERFKIAGIDLPQNIFDPNTVFEV